MALPDRTLCWVEGPPWDRVCEPVGDGGVSMPAELQAAAEALESLRAAWNEHMKTCPQHADVPSMAEIDAWMNAPSNTASAEIKESPNG